MTAKDRERKRSGAPKRDAETPLLDPHRAREQARYESPIASREHIRDVLLAAVGPVDFEALAERLGLAGDEQGEEALRRRVAAMLRDGQLIQNRRRGLVPVDDDSLIAGKISAHPDGFGFLITEDEQRDIFLNARQMRQALHGDRAVVCITGTDRRGRPEGRIVDIVERANRTLVGRLVREQGVVFVVPDNKRIHQDLMISPGQTGGADSGDMVVAEITEQPNRRQPPVGRVVEVLGQHLTAGMEIDVALHSHGIPVDWPDDVLDQAAAFPARVPETASAGRKDLRDRPLITIDGADARDFDDAVWCQATTDGWKLIVAIADVAEYVKLDAPLDVEAKNRGTSVYFPGRVVPMLPEVLSNGLCSLNPDVDRLCLACEMTIDSDGQVIRSRFHEAVLRSAARLTYSQVHQMLTGQESQSGSTTNEASTLRKQHASLLESIEALHGLYKVLAKARRRRGAIEFDSTETRIVFDDDRKIRELVPIVRNDAHKLIEECMILANIEAARFLEAHELPALYRVHSGPKPDRLEDLRAFLALRGLSMGGGDTPTPLDYAALADAIDDRMDKTIIQTVMLRSMQQAVYQPANAGHFGLALTEYAHFTSPIRRYPDLLVHRAIKHRLRTKKARDYPYTPAEMQSLGESCSMTERRAEEASRDVVSWLKCEYMQAHVGDRFEGLVTAVTGFGLFVELIGIHVEGLIHITNLSRDFYRFEAQAHALIGEHTGRSYRLGDRMVVEVSAVNLDERKIDFAEISHTPAQMHREQGRGSKSNDRRSAAPREAVTSDEEDKRQRRAKRRAEKRALRDQASLLSDSERGARKQTSESDESTHAGEKKPSGKHASGKGASSKSASSKSASGKRASSKSASGKSASGKSASGKSASGKSASGKSASGRSASSKKAAAKKKAVGKKAVGKKAIRKKTAGKKAAGQKPAGKRRVGKETAGKKAGSKKAAGNKDSGKNAAGNNTAGKTAAGNTAAGTKAMVKKTASKKSAGKKVAKRKAAGNRVRARSGTARTRRKKLN